MKEEKRIIDLMKMEYEAMIKSNNAYLALLMHAATILKLNHPASISEQEVLGKICPTDKKSKFVINKDKYECADCGLEFDKKLWDEAAKVIESRRKIIHHVYTEAEKLQQIFSNPKEQGKLGSELERKYGKEPWWDINFLWQQVFGRSH